MPADSRSGCIGPTLLKKEYGYEKLHGGRQPSRSARADHPSQTPPACDDYRIEGKRIKRKGKDYCYALFYIPTRRRMHK